MAIDEIIQIGKRNGDQLMILVQFAKKASVRKVFERTRLLAGTCWRIERDYSPEIRQQIVKLVKVKKIIQANLVDRRDKNIIIKVNGGQMKINNNIFFWRDDQLWCGAEPGYINLNKIFVYKFLLTI